LIENPVSAHKRVLTTPDGRAPDLAAAADLIIISLDKR